MKVVQALTKLLSLPPPVYLLRMCSIISDVTASVDTCLVFTSSPSAGDISELVSFIWSCCVRQTLADDAVLFLAVHWRPVDVIAAHCPGLAGGFYGTSATVFMGRCLGT